MGEDAEKEEAAVAGDGQPPALSKSARKKQHKQERLAAEKERQRADVERRRHEWEEALAAAPSEEARIEMVAARRERVGQRAEERGARAERLQRAAEGAEQKVVLDLEFGDLMRPNEIHSLLTLPCPATPDPAATYAPDVAQPRRSPAATNAPMRPIPLFLRDDDLAGKSHGLNASSPPGHATSPAAANSCAPSPAEANSCAPSPPTSSARWPPSLVRALQLPWCQPTSDAIASLFPFLSCLLSLSRHAVVGRDTQWSLRGRIMKENTQDRDWEGVMSFESTRFFWVGKELVTPLFSCFQSGWELCRIIYSNFMGQPNSLTFGIKFQFKDSMPNSWQPNRELKNL